MKNVKSWVLAAGVALAAVPGVHAQMAVLDTGVAAILSATKADQAVYYAQSLVEMYNNAQNTYNQFQNLLRAEQRMMDNLKGVANVKNFDDLMKWQNRQLYLESERESRIKNLGIKIGENTYKITDIENIPEAMRNKYGDEFWADFSDAQRKEMYTRLGLSPSNYVYLQTWEERAKKAADEFMFKADVINEENEKAYSNYAETIKKYDEDKYKPENEKIQDKELLMDNATTAMDTNKVLRTMAYDNARYHQWQYAQDKMAETPPTPPQLSDSYNDDPFIPLTGNK